METIELTLPIFAVTGALASILTAVANRPGWTSQRKLRTSQVIAVVLGLVAALISGRLQPPVGVSWPWWQDAIAILTWGVASVALVAAFSNAVYNAFWDKIKALEGATSNTETEEKAE